MIEKGKVLFDESNLPIIIQRKKEIWHSKETIFIRKLIYVAFIPIFAISLTILIFDLESLTLVGRIGISSLIFTIGFFFIIDFLGYNDDKKDLIIYEKGIIIPDKPLVYILRHENWFVPFSKIHSISREKENLVVRFKDDFSRNKYIPVNYIYDWVKFKSSLEGKVKLHL